MKRFNLILSLVVVTLVMISMTGCIFPKGKTDGNTPSTDAPDNQIHTQYSSDSDTQAEPITPDNQATEVIKPETTAPEEVTEETVVNEPEPTTQAPVITDTGITSYSAQYNGRTQVVFYSQSILDDNKTYPVLIFANGTAVDYTLYEKLLVKLAEGGYIVVANNEKMAADGSAQIDSLDFIISENSNSSSVLCGKINTEKAAAVGHSQGGRSAVNAAAKDSRFDCVLSLAGSNYTEEAEILRTPALFMAGTKDMIVNADKWVKPAYDVAKGPAVYVSLVNGVHTSCCTDPDTYANYAVKWFDIWLKNDNSAKDTFRNGGDLANDSAWTQFSCKNL